MTGGEEPIASASATDRVFSDVVIGFEPGVGGKAGRRGAAFDDMAQTPRRVSIVPRAFARRPAPRRRTHRAIRLSMGFGDRFRHEPAVLNMVGLLSNLTQEGSSVDVVLDAGTSDRG